MTTALWISILGMTILFGAIVALAALMYLLTWLTAPRPAQRGDTEDVAEELADQAEQERRRRVAAIAAALALAEAQSRPSPATADEIPSPWRVVHRARRFSFRPGARK